MLTIRIDEDTAIEMLVERVTQWTEDEDVIELYRRMYDHYVYSGVFDYGERGIYSYIAIMRKIKRISFVDNELLIKIDGLQYKIGTYEEI